MHYYNNLLQNHILFLLTDTTITSDNPSRFRENLLKRMYKLIMAIYGKIRDGKLQCDDINREAAKISALSSGKTDKYE